MSIATWLEEFMPVPASICANEAPKGLKGDLALLDHSIRKWEGLVEGNLKKHDVLADHKGDLYEREPSGRPSEWLEVLIDSSTCSLCKRYDADRSLSDEERCNGCPLAYVRDGVPCCQPMPGERFDPFRAWCDRRDPEPMIHWLRLARASVVERLKKESSDD